MLLAFIFIISSIIAKEENFILIDSHSKITLQEFGSHIDKRESPCSTFKIALSLMGFDSNILQNMNYPLWDFKPGYDDFLPSWKTFQTPSTWIKTSCVWYSRVLATHLGKELLEYYLNAFNYGNQDISGGVTNFWLTSSLEISPREQVLFLHNILEGNLEISLYAIEETKNLLFIEQLPDGSKLFGKTGWSGSAKENGRNELGWFVGWQEKEGLFFPFAYNIVDDKIDLSQRIPRVKELLMQQYKTIKEPSKKIIGISCKTSNTSGTAPEDIGKLWQKFYQESISSQIPNKISDEIIALYCEYEGDWTKPYSLIIGHVVNSLNNIPSGMVGKEIPGGTYACFTAAGEHPATLIETWKRIWSNTTLQRTYTGDYELYNHRFFLQSPQEVNVFIAIQ
jgi:beta-lactamase class D